MEPTPRNAPKLGKTVGASALSGGGEATLPLQGGDVVQHRPFTTTIWVTLGMERMGWH